MVPAPVRVGAIAAADSPAGVRRRTRKVGSGDERIKLVGSRRAINYHATAQFELGYGVGLQGGLLVERQGLIDTPRFQLVYILSPKAVSTVRNMGERKMETAILVLVCRVELQSYEYARADLRGFWEYFIRLGVTYCHDEVWRNAFNAIGEYDGVLVARKGGWREDRS